LYFFRVFRTHSNRHTVEYLHFAPFLRVIDYLAVTFAILQASTVTSLSCRLELPLRPPPLQDPLVVIHGFNRMHHYFDQKSAPSSLYVPEIKVPQVCLYRNVFHSSPQGKWGGSYMILEKPIKIVFEDENRECWTLDHVYQLYPIRGLSPRNQPYLITYHKRPRV
jgi:hypothetical protein